MKSGTSEGRNIGKKDSSQMGVHQGGGREGTESLSEQAVGDDKRAGLCLKGGGSELCDGKGETRFLRGEPDRERGLQVHLGGERD